MIVIQAIDQSGNRWFRNADGAWQEKRDSSCHFATPVAASKAYQSARTQDRFKSVADRMDSIEMVQLT